jgi:predicted PurR-regulated permease PerM
MMNRSPRELVAMWLPHLFILSILGMSLLLMIWVLQPLLPVLLMSAALSALTYPVITGPVHSWFDLRLPNLAIATKRRMSGVVAMVIIVLAVLLPILAGIVMLIGHSDINGELLMGMLSKNLGQVDLVLVKLMKQMDVIRELYPQIPFPPSEWVKGYIKEALVGLLDLQPALMSFFFKGTGSIMVQVLLCIMGMVFFYSEGGVLAKGIFRYTPLSNDNVSDLMNTFRNVILRFMIDTMGIAILQGTLLGVLVGLFLGLNPIILIFFASFISLLPLVGTTLIWLPAATLLYKQGHWGQAVAVVILCQASIMLSSHLVKKVGVRLHEHSATTSFFIFISVIGGIVSFGVKGLVLGPMAVILVMVLGQYWKGYYQQEILDS